MKNKYLQLRVSEEDKDKLKKYAESTGRTISGFLLWAAKKEMEGK